MSEPIAIDASDIPWEEGRSQTTSDGRRLVVHRRFPIAHLDPGPWFGHVHYEPGLRVERHAHPANEIIYLVAGQLTVGDRICEPGTAITVEAGTVYGPLIAGPEGAEFFLIMDRDPSRRPHQEARERGA